MDDADLDLLFEAAKSTPVAPSDALISAILADAQTHMPAAAVLGRAPEKPQSRLGLWLSAIGGWPSVASMATATVAGVWFGFASPDQVESFSGGIALAGDYAVSEVIYAPEDLVPGYAGLDLLTLEEG